ncbi:membrane-binding protein [uncultured Methanomethylovorans sp.]|uniref:membrane-binding protein n=1 Tax=uncultured Methanomethylovorans sp. TaxID=183759 RepID=UPI002AA807BD|nr:membrane-binding protein [uncultured Methanomethylovorans sp.]
MNVKWLIVAILLIAVAASGCGGKDTTTYETDNGTKVEVTTDQKNQDSWCPVGTSWKTSNPTTGEEVSMMYTGSKEVDGVPMCVMEYKSTNPEDEVARVEYMFSEDSETFSWKSYYANGTVMSEMTMKDGKTTMIDENGKVTEFQSNQ